MNFPHIAYRTFQRLKGHPFFSQLFNNLTKTLSEITTAKARARFVHSQVDADLKELWQANPLAAKGVSCTKGCTACCHTQVSVTHDEADLLAGLVDKKVVIDADRLALQAKAGDDSAAWYKLSHQDRACVFLSSDGECRIYDDRPSVCRTNFVFSPPKDCSTEDGSIRAVRLLTAEKADITIMAHFTFSRNNGALPRMLKAILDKRKRPKSTKKSSSRSRLEGPDAGR